MRKKNVNHILDVVFWDVVYLLPLLAYLFYLLPFNDGSVSITSFSDFINTIGFGTSQVGTNPIYTALSSLFASVEFLNCFNTNGILLFASYYANVTLIHFVIDVLIFIPHICMNWMDKFTDFAGK